MAENPERLQSVVESVYLKLVTRIGVPAMIALLGYLGSQELSKISQALDVIPQLVIDQKIMGVKMDQMQKDLASQSSVIYSRDDAGKDWKIQAQKDEMQDASLKDHDKRIQTLEQRVLK